MKKVDIVFIHPPYPDAEGIKQDGHLPSIGLLNLAALAEKEGLRVAIVDSVALGYTSERTVREVIALNPRYVGLTAMTHNITTAAVIAKNLKEQNRNLVTLLGGVHISSVPEETLNKFPDCFDISILGEGELIFLATLRALENNSDIDYISGLAFMKDGKFIKTGEGGMIQELDELPFPAWHLLPDMSTHYATTFISGNQKVSNHLLTSRGCPGRCVFCDTTVFGGKIRGYSPDYVVEMVDILYNKYGVRDIQFNDDTFTSLRSRLHEICELLIKKNYNDLTWSCDARVSGMSEESLALMKAAGCWQIAFGVETGSQEIMDFLKKYVTFEQIHNAFHWAKKVGISTKGFFIIGHPTETMETLNATVDLMLELPIDVVGVTHFTAYPGSPIYSSIAKYGAFDSDWNNVNTYDVGNFIPDGFTAKQLKDLRRKAIRRFYLRPRYVFNQIMAVKSFSEVIKLFIGFWKLLAKFVLRRTTTSKTSFGDLTLESKLDSILED